MSYFYIKITKEKDYLNWDFIEFYDLNGNLINLDYTNIISHTFTTRTGNSNLSSLFIRGSEEYWEPYNSSIEPSETILKFNIPFNKIMARDYINNHSNGKMGIYYSTDNISYTKITEFPMDNSNITTIELNDISFFKLNKILVEDNSQLKYFNTDNESFEIINDSLSENIFKLYGSDTLDIIINNVSQLSNNFKILIFDKGDTILNFKTSILNKDKIIISDNFNLGDIFKINSLVIESSDGGIKILCSPDDGASWYAYKNNSWEITSDIKNGNTVLEFNNILENFNELLNTQKILKFKFYLTFDDFYINKLEMTIDLKGYYEKISDYNYKTYVMNDFIKINILSPGTYKINY